MNFETAALPVEFTGGLAGLKNDYNFYLNGKTVLAAKYRQTARITGTVRTVLFRLQRNASFTANSLNC